MKNRLVVFIGSALGFIAPVAFAQSPSPLKGHWTLNQKLSGDIEGRIKEAAGSQYMKGGPGWRPPDAWLPIGVKFDENDRLEVRKFLLAVVPVLQDLEIQVTPTEIKTVHGEGGVRIFSLTRKSSGASAMTGETVTRHAVLEGATLRLESKGKDGVLTETITVGAQGQMSYALRFEAKLLEKPLDLSLVYDRTAR